MTDTATDEVNAALDDLQRAFAQKYEAMSPAVACEGNRLASVARARILDLFAAERRGAGSPRRSAYRSGYLNGRVEALYDPEWLDAERTAALADAYADDYVATQTAAPADTTATAGEPHA